MTRALPYIWYPLFVGAAIALFFALLAHEVVPSLCAYVPVVLVGLSILLLELRFPERLDWRPARSDLVSDSAFMAVVMIALPRLLAPIAIITLASYTHASDASSWWLHDWPLLTQIVVMVLVVDFVRYWLHRACHHFIPLWRLHEVHHSPDVLYVVNVGRFHPLEKVLHFSLDTVPFLLLGIAPEVLAGYFLLYSVNGLFQHSNVRLRYGWLNYLVGSAETHRWHHARDPKLASCNFGNTTILWDLVFGTWHLRGAVGDIGIMNRAYPKGFLAQMVAPFKKAAESRSLGRVMADKIISARLTISDWLARIWLGRVINDPMRVQRKVLHEILEANRDTRFGRQYGFERIDSYESFARSVPVSDFEQLRAFIDSEIASQDAALTRDEPVCYVRTSGTTGTPKDVPLTQGHLASLRRIHRQSIAFQFRVCPEAFKGAIVAMVSPSSEGTLSNGRPYGSASGILAQSTSAAVRCKFAVPPEVFTIADSHLKYLLVLRIAIALRDLTYLGAANPSTLLALMKLFREHQETLISDVRHGTFFLARSLPQEVSDAVVAHLRADPLRADELHRLSQELPFVRIHDVWPSLRLIVTWTCASAGVALEALRAELSKSMRVMELGYISSEFRGTITVGRRSGSGLPTLDTYFFEFVELDAWDNEQPRYLTLDQVEKGRDYYVIVTTPSGLYRYFINDIVRVTGFLGATPLMKFSQKGKGVTSITGEKLYEAQVLQAVREAMHATGSRARFMMMLADEEAHRYRLYVESDLVPAVSASALANDVDERLRSLNLEYEAKRESERLGPLEAYWLRGGTGERYRAHCIENGQREGQFKMVALDYRRRFSFDLDACLLER
jgi:sterol desaturase/sphingolipid hydroxylase (fatty acid hydroxylase superfamily)